MMEKKRKAIFFIAILLYDCIFVNFKYDDEYHIIQSLFPHKLFKMVASQDVDHRNLCFSKGNCKANKLEKGILPVCYCDEKCSEYNDCCADVSFDDNAVTKTNMEDDKMFKSCVNKVFYNKYFGILMVANCPSDFADVSKKCTNAQNKHPVSADDGTIYKNVYCAYCHNVSRYTTWHFEYLYTYGLCSVEGIEELNFTIPAKMKYIIENECIYYFLPPPNAKYRTCFIDRHETTNPLCSKFQSPIKVDDKLYRNVHCYNGSAYIDTPNCLQVQKVNNPDVKGFGDVHLTRIFNVRPVLEIYGKKQCGANFYYDMTQETCIPNVCREKPTSACDMELIRNFKWTKTLRYVSDDILNKNFIYRLSRFIFLSFPVERYDITLVSINGNYRCGRTINSTDKHCCIGFVTLVVNNHAEMIPENTLKFLSDATEMKWLYQERMIKTQVTAFDLNENLFMNATCNITGSSRYFTNTFGTALSLSTYDFVNSNMTKILNKIPKRVKGIATMVSGRNGSRPKFRLEIWHYTARETKHFTYQKGIDFLTVGSILTYTTLGISCCSLMVTLVVYSKFGLFRSRPGVISKHMIGNMLAAQLLFIVGAGASDVTVICTIIGIISHFLWLCSFTWISAFLFSILKMVALLHTYPGALSKERKFSKAFYCFGYMLPFLIVLSCSVLDIFTEIDIGYSNGGICFPTGLLANLFSFTLPVVLSLCINIVVLIITSISMARYNNTTLLLQSVRKIRSFIPTYIRLSILCACPWVLGIIADIVESDILRYVFILLAGSHGTFVGFSFLLAKSVRRRVRCNSKIITNETEYTDRRKSTNVVLTG